MAIAMATIAVVENVLEINPWSRIQIAHLPSNRLSCDTVFEYRTKQQQFYSIPIEQELVRSVCNKKVPCQQKNPPTPNGNRGNNRQIRRPKTAIAISLPTASPS